MTGSRGAPGRSAELRGIRRFFQLPGGPWQETGRGNRTGPAGRNWGHRPVTVRGRQEPGRKLAYTRNQASLEDDLTMQATESGRAMVVSTEPAGLGNRIKSWVSAMRLGADVRVYWPLSPIMPARFGDLFANDCEVDEVPDGAREYVSWRLVILPEDAAHLPRGFAVVGAGANRLVRGTGKLLWQLRGRKTDRYRYMVFPKKHSRRSARADARHIDFEYGRIPEYFRSVYCPLFDQIRVLPSIAERVSAWGGGAHRRRRDRAPGQDVAGRSAAAPQVSRALPEPDA